MNWFKAMMMKVFKIEPAKDQSITIVEPLSFRANVLKNQVWYRGEPSELGQFFSSAITDLSSATRFWAISYISKVRKVHSGLPKMIIDKYCDIILGDLDAITINREDGEIDEETTSRWEEIAKDNKFTKILEHAIQGALTCGDGAFKLSYDKEVTDYPILEFYTADKVEYEHKRGRLHEVRFFTPYHHNKRDYKLCEIYGKGYIEYKLFNEDGKEMPINFIPQTADLVDVQFNGDFIMAVPLMFFESVKWHGRGEALMDSKTDVLDALDEDISQFVDSIRSARTQKYIPEDMLPRNPNTGVIRESNDFENRYIAVGANMAEGAKSEISVVTPQIIYEAYQAGYATFLDLCMVGVISPSTLGIDLKKTDNAEAQREKEKTTLYTRGKLVDVLNEVIPELVDLTLRVHDLMNGSQPKDYEVSVAFGEYASPSFNDVVEVVGKAVTLGIMSLDKAVDELYGDTMTDDEKMAELKAIKGDKVGETFEPITIDEEIDV